MRIKIFLRSFVHVPKPLSNPLHEVYAYEALNTVTFFSNAFGILNGGNIR